MIEWLHPGIVLIVGALLIPLVKGKAKQVYMVALPAAALIDCISMSPGTYGVVHFLNYDLVFGRVDRLSLIFSYHSLVSRRIYLKNLWHVQSDTIWNFHRNNSQTGFSPVL